MASSSLGLACVVLRVSLLGLSAGAKPLRNDNIIGKDCPAGWLGPNSDSCYKLIANKPMTWQDANTHGCSDVDSRAYLATLTFANKAFISKQEDIMATYYFWIAPRSSDAYWSEEDTSSGHKAELPYTNWEKIRQVEPTGSRDLKDNCVMVIGKQAMDMFQHPGYWLDFDCSSKFLSLCQMRSGDNTCPDNWAERNGVCYRLTATPSSWQNANSECDFLYDDAELASVPFTYEEMKDSGIYDAEFFWVALKSDNFDDEGKLRWSDTEAAEVTDTNWLSLSHDEPTGSAEGDDDCIMVSGLKAGEVFAPGEWGDYSCSFRTGFLCAIDLTW